jgi:integrase
MPAKLAFTTDRLVRLTCPPDLDRIYVADTRTPCLTICVTRAGQRTFYVYRRYLGKPTRFPLGQFPGELSVEDARRKAVVWNGMIADGIDPRQAKRTARAEMTFGELWADYLDKHVKARRRPRTQAEYERQFNVYLASWKGRRLSQIDRAAVGALHARLGQTNGKYQANRVLALVHSLFTWATNHFGYRDGNPAAGIEKFPERSRERFLLPDEMERFFAALDAEAGDDEKYADLFRLALFTGARMSNLKAMRFEHVNLDRAEWTIPGEQTKNGEPVTIPLVPDAVEIVRRRRLATRGNHLFPGRHGGHVQDANKPWQRIIERAKLPDLRMHDLRRSLGSWQAASGASLPIIGRTLGHRSTAATQIYARLQQAGDPVREAIATATAAMLAAANNGKETGNG